MALTCGLLDYISRSSACSLFTYPFPARPQQDVSHSEIERWNRVLTSPNPTFNTKPNEFLVEVASKRRPGRALDVGMGQGRNAIWLAQQGWDLTGFDPAGDAVALAQRSAERLRLKVNMQVMRMEDFDFGERRWDLILLSYVPARGIFDRLPRALRPSGVLIIEAFHRDATRSIQIGGGGIFDTQELPKLFPQLRALRYEEPVRRADFGLQSVRVVRYCGERPE